MVVYCFLEFLIQIPKKDRTIQLNNKIKEICLPTYDLP